MGSRGSKAGFPHVTTSVPSSWLTGSHDYPAFADKETEVGKWRAEFKLLAGQMVEAPMVASCSWQGSSCTSAAS